MTEETKKLIIPGMLSDVLDAEIVEALFDDGELYPLEMDGMHKRNATQYPRGLSEAELKDKLEEWIIDNKPEGKEYGLYYDGAWSVEIEGDHVSSLYSSNDCKTKLEALALLYNEMKADK